MTSGKTTHSVILLGFDASAQHDAVARLQKAFRISEAQAQRFISQMPVIVKRNATAKQASGYLKRLESIGAQVQVKPPLADAAPRFGDAPAPPDAAPAAAPHFGDAAPAPRFGSGPDAPKPLFGGDDAPGWGADPLGAGEASPHFGGDAQPQLGAAVGAPWADQDEPGAGVGQPDAEMSNNWFQPTQTLGGGGGFSIGSMADPLPSMPAAARQMECPRCGATNDREDASCSTCGFALQSFAKSSTTIEFDLNLLSGDPAQNVPILSDHLSAIDVEAQDPQVKQTFTNLLLYNQLNATDNPEEILAAAAAVQPPTEDSALAHLGAGIPSSPTLSSGPTPALERPTLTRNPYDITDDERAAAEQETNSGEFSAAVAPSGGHRAIKRPGGPPDPNSPIELESEVSKREDALTSDRAKALEAYKNQVGPPASQTSVFQEVEFWPAVPRAFMVPFWGRGALWLVVLGAVLTLIGVMSVAPILCVKPFVMIGLGSVYLGLLGAFFGQAAQIGLDGEFDGPDPSILRELTSNASRFAYPGLALSILAAILFAIPAWITVKAVPEPTPEVSVRAIAENETFYDAEGEPLDLGAVADTTAPIQARAQDGSEVIVNLNDQTVSAASATPTDGSTDTPSLPLTSKLTIFLAFLLPYLYWPMGLTVSALTGSLANLFNPIYVAKGIFRGGLPYLFVVFIGVTLPTLIGALSCGLIGGGSAIGGIGGSIATALAFVLVLVSSSYVTGVQGFLMGRLVASRPDAFDDFT